MRRYMGNEGNAKYFKKYKEETEKECFRGKEEWRKE